MIEHSILL